MDTITPASSRFPLSIMIWEWWRARRASTGLVRDLFGLR